MFTPTQLALVAASAVFAELTRIACWKMGLVTRPAKTSLGWGAFCMASAAVATLAITAVVPWPDSAASAGYCALLAAMSTIDLEEKLLPKGVWFVAIPPVLAISWLVPSILGELSPPAALSAAAIGAVVSAAVLYAMVELGKLMFGKLVMTFDPPEKYTLEMRENEWIVSSAGEKMLLSEIMLRPTDSMIIQEQSGSTIRIWESEWENPAGSPRSPLAEHSGNAVSLTVPREAMGMGDVKFMLLAGAMVGWEGGVFSIFAGALLGTVAGLAAKLVRGQAEIPFIPFLAAGVVIFMVWAPEIRASFSSALWGY